MERKAASEQRIAAERVYAAEQSARIVKENAEQLLKKQVVCPKCGHSFDPEKTESDLDW